MLIQISVEHTVDNHQTPGYRSSKSQWLQPRSHLRKNIVPLYRWVVYTWVLTIPSQLSRRSGDHDNVGMLRYQASLLLETTPHPMQVQDINNFKPNTFLTHNLIVHDFLNVVNLLEKSYLVLRVCENIMTKQHISCRNLVQINSIVDEVVCNIVIIFKTRTANANATPWTHIHIHTQTHRHT